jgi:hypothetical protein
MKEPTDKAAMIMATAIQISGSFLVFMETFICHFL